MGDGLARMPLALGFTVTFVVAQVWRLLLAQADN